MPYQHGSGVPNIMGKVMGKPFEQSEQGPKKEVRFDSVPQIKTFVTTKSNSCQQSTLDQKVYKHTDKVFKFSIATFPHLVIMLRIICSDFLMTSKLCC